MPEHYESVDQTTLTAEVVRNNASDEKPLFAKGCDPIVIQLGHDKGFHVFHNYLRYGDWYHVAVAATTTHLFLPNRFTRVKEIAILFLVFVRALILP
jgi:hypothetical protein